MRHIALVALASWLLLTTDTAHAQPNIQPGETVLVDDTFRMYPGADLRQCFDVAVLSRLQVRVSSVPGRTGETATLNFRDDRQTTDPNVQLFVQVPDEPVMSAHLAPAGSYCYYLGVTHNLTSILPPDAPERPTKDIRLRITAMPSD